MVKDVLFNVIYYTFTVLTTKLYYAVPLTVVEAKILRVKVSEFKMLFRRHNRPYNRFQYSIYRSNWLQIFNIFDINSIKCIELPLPDESIGMQCNGENEIERSYFFLCNLI